MTMYNVFVALRVYLILYHSTSFQLAWGLNFQSINWLGLLLPYNALLFFHLKLIAFFCTQNGLLGSDFVLALLTSTRYCSVKYHIILCRELLMKISPTSLPMTILLVLYIPVIPTESWVQVFTVYSFRIYYTSGN